MTDAKLKAYVERIDRLMTVVDEAREDIGEVVKEAKGDGYIPKTLRKVATRYHADPEKIATEDALLETYEAALGKLGRALAAIRGGATWEEARKEHDVPRATMARARAVSKRREVIPAKEEARQEEEVAAGRDAIPGLGVADRSATSPGGSEHRLPALGRSAVVPLGCNTHPQPDEVSTGDQPAPCESPSGSSGPALCGDQPPPTESLGAVAKPEAERVASPDPDADDLAIPPFLRGMRVPGHAF